jgi:hypothetical protein
LWKSEKFSGFVCFNKTKTTMNIRLASLGIVVGCSVIKIFSFYWIFVILSCVVVAVLTIVAVILSASPNQSLRGVLSNPLEQQQKIWLGFNCEY